MIKENLTNVLNNISVAAKHSKHAQDVHLIAVSKTHPAEMVLEAYNLGIRDFGENKVQELLSKYDSLPSDIRWHLIGHLQTNKVKYIVDKVYLIHSVDSYKLALEIDKQAKKKGIVVNILIQVNISGEESKFGIEKEGAIELVKEVSTLNNVKIKGLMTIAPASENPENSRGYFASLYNLSIDILALNIDNINELILSMGMSNDYLVAIDEGANFVRVGTDIFGKRDYNREINHKGD